MFRMPESQSHERLHVIDDKETGLTGVIAIHSTALGPAAGGCRVWRYPSNQHLVDDALRLAQGMSYKNALAGLPFGGGKAVLQFPEGECDREALFTAFGRAVAALDGAYITAEDVGTKMADMQTVRRVTQFVSGLEAAGSAAGGDPSPFTARGVFESMKASAPVALGMPLRGATVAVQGVGNVGAHLARMLHNEGARMILADIDEARCAALSKELGATMVGIDEILAADADVFAPCALGGVINDVSVQRLKARLVCGAANNQLERPHHGEALRSRGIVYAPDYVVNAGGIINVSAEYLGESSHSVEQRLSQIAPRLLSILKEAAARELPSNVVADEAAKRAIAGSFRAAA